MHRDFDLIREMMLSLESNAELIGRASFEGYATSFFPNLGKDDDTLAYHLMLIIDEGWLDGEYIRVSGKFILVRLTADGHDFIEVTRQKSIWDQAKAAIKAGGGETLRFAWEISKKIAEAEIQRRLKIE